MAASSGHHTVALQRAAVTAAAALPRVWRRVPPASSLLQSCERLGEIKTSSKMQLDAQKRRRGSAAGGIMASRLVNDLRCAAYTLLLTLPTNGVQSSRRRTILKPFLRASSDRPGALRFILLAVDF